MAGWPIRMPNAALSWRGHVAGRDSNAVVRRRRVRSRRVDSALSRAPRANEGGQQRHAPCSHRHLRPEADRQRQIAVTRSEEHTSELQSRENLEYRLLLKK